MSQWILKGNGNVVARRSARPLHTAELHSPIEVKKRKVFDELIERRLGTSINPPKPEPTSKTNPEEDGVSPEEDCEPKDEGIPDIEDIVDSTGKVLDQQPAYDNLINAD